MRVWGQFSVKQSMIVKFRKILLGCVALAFFWSGLQETWGMLRQRVSHEEHIQRHARSFFQHSVKPAQLEEIVSLLREVPPQELDTVVEWAQAFRKPLGHVPKVELIQTVLCLPTDARVSLCQSATHLLSCSPSRQGQSDRLHLILDHLMKLYPHGHEALYLGPFIPFYFKYQGQSLISSVEHLMAEERSTILLGTESLLRSEMEPRQVVGLLEFMKNLPGPERVSIRDNFTRLVPKNLYVDKGESIKLLEFLRSIDPIERLEFSNFASTVLGCAGAPKDSHCSLHHLQILKAIVEQERSSFLQVVLSFVEQLLPSQRSFEIVEAFAITPFEQRASMVPHVHLFLQHFPNTRKLKPFVSSVLSLEEENRMFFTSMVAAYVYDSKLATVVQSIPLSEREETRLSVSTMGDFLKSQEKKRARRETLSGSRVIEILLKILSGERLDFVKMSVPVLESLMSGHSYYSKDEEFTQKTEKTLTYLSGLPSQERPSVMTLALLFPFKEFYDFQSICKALMLIPSDEREYVCGQVIGCGVRSYSNLDKIFAAVGAIEREYRPELLDMAQYLQRQKWWERAYEPLISIMNALSIIPPHRLKEFRGAITPFLDNQEKEHPEKDQIFEWLANKFNQMSRELFEEFLESIDRARTLWIDLKGEKAVPVLETLISNSPADRNSLIASAMRFSSTPKIRPGTVLNLMESLRKVPAYGREHFLDVVLELTQRLISEEEYNRAAEMYDHKRYERETSAFLDGQWRHRIYGRGFVSYSFGRGSDPYSDGSWDFTGDDDYDETASDDHYRGPSSWADDPSDDYHEATPRRGGGGTYQGGVSQPKLSHGDFLDAVAAVSPENLDSVGVFVKEFLTPEMEIKGAMALVKAVRSLELETIQQLHHILAHSEGLYLRGIAPIEDLIILIKSLVNVSSREREGCFRDALLFLRNLKKLGEGEGWNRQGEYPPYGLVQIIQSFGVMTSDQRNQTALYVSSLLGASTYSGNVSGIGTLLTLCKDISQRDKDNIVDCKALISRFGRMDEMTVGELISLLLSLPFEERMARCQYVCSLFTDPTIMRLPHEYQDTDDYYTEGLHQKYSYFMWILQETQNLSTGESQSIKECLSRSMKGVVGTPQTIWDLIKILVKIPHEERFILSQYVEQVLTKPVKGNRVPLVFSLVRSMGLEERQRFFSPIKILFSAPGGVNSRGEIGAQDILKTLRAITPLGLEAVIEGALQLSPRNSFTVQGLLDALNSIVPLVKILPDRERSEIWSILKALSPGPQVLRDDDAYYSYGYAEDAHFMSYVGYVNIDPLRKIIAMGAEERQQVSSLALLLISPQMSWHDRSTIIRALKRLPVAQRAQRVQQVLERLTEDIVRHELLETQRLSRIIQLLEDPTSVFSRRHLAVQGQEAIMQDRQRVVKVYGELAVHPSTATLISKHLPPARSGFQPSCPILKRHMALMALFSKKPAEKFYLEKASQGIDYLQTIRHEFTIDIKIPPLPRLFGLIYTLLNYDFTIEGYFAEWLREREVQDPKEWTRVKAVFAHTFPGVMSHGTVGRILDFDFGQGGNFMGTLASFMRGEQQPLSHQERRLLMRVSRGYLKTFKERNTPLLEALIMSVRGHNKNLLDPAEANRNACADGVMVRLLRTLSEIRETQEIARPLAHMEIVSCP